MFAKCLIHLDHQVSGKFIGAIRKELKVNNKTLIGYWKNADAKVIGI